MKYWILLLSFIFNFGCTKKDASTTVDAATTTATDTSATTDTTGTTTTTTTTESVNLGTKVGVVSTNIGNVGNSMIPGSLALDVASLKLSEGGPCGATGFFGCQPILLKVYMDIGKQMVAMMNAFVSIISTTIFKDYTASATGAKICDTLEHTSTAEAPFTKVEYCITSASKYEFEIFGENGAFLNVSVDDKVYTMNADVTKMPSDDAGSGGPSKIKSTITYTDENNYVVDVKLADSACQADDVRGPGNIVLNIQKSGAYWQGKSMLYHPRWIFSGDSVTCDTTPTDDMALGFYTDFVGNDDNTTASIYFMPGSLSDIADISIYPVSNFCTTFPDMCMGGRSMGDSNIIATTYPNPFCVDSANNITWGEACSSTVTEIATPTYSDESNWQTPADISELTVTIPTTIIE